MKARQSRRVIWTRMAFLAALVMSAHASGQTLAARPLRMGFMTYNFLGVDVLDARIATDMWLGQVADSMDEEVSPQSVVFSNLDDVVEALGNGGLEVMSLGVLDYLALRDRAPTEAALVAAFVGEKVLDEYVLLVHRDEAPASLVELRGKRIRIGAWPSTMAIMWLDVLLGREGLPESQVFFGALEPRQSPSHTILPVFFKQVDGCIVEHRRFAALAELNPQIARDLVVWARLPDILPGVVCFPADGDPELRALARNAALRLHTNEVGRQVLTLFRSHRVLPFAPEQLRGVLALVTEHERLEKGEGGTP